ncbi:MAG: class I SAM-dependent methyltransferase [Pseudomonadota bacterium]|nr:class I SAM-dependent methyltransferase [Pseudomonadota bacterium]
MNLVEKARVQAFHRARFGAAPIAELGFRSADSQLQRFATLCRWGDMSGSLVLDLGCGHGDLRPYLAARFTDTEYLGLDFLKEFVAVAEERHGHLPGTQFLQADFLSVGLPEVDIAIASGSLNYRSDNELHPWQAISRMWECARKGVAFNLLDARHFIADEILCGYDPDEVLRFCRQLDAKAELITGYLPDDMTVLLRR